MGRRLAKYVLWKVERRWKIKGWCITFGGDGDNEYRFSGVMWADSYCLFSDDEEKLMWVNDILEELLDLDMEPKPESLWWMSTHTDEDERMLKVERRGKSWDLPFVEAFDFLWCRFRRTGQVQGAEKTLRNCLGSW